jgi:hypothetical protein
MKCRKNQALFPPFDGKQTYLVILDIELAIYAVFARSINCGLRGMKETWHNERQLRPLSRFVAHRID